MQNAAARLLQPSPFARASRGALAVSLLLGALLLLMLAWAPRAQAQAKAEANPSAPRARAQGPAAKKWLVLAPLGLTAAEDKDGFNKTYGSTAASFANALQGVLKPGGIQGAIVIDQTPTSGKPTTEKIRQHLAATQAGVLLLITMVGDDSPNGRSMSLRLQYAEVEWQTAEGKQTGFSLSHPLVRDYPLWSEKQGNNQANYSSMAKDFLAYLSSEGRLK
jgi:hypothetical protein